MTSIATAAPVEPRLAKTAAAPRCGRLREAAEVLFRQPIQDQSEADLTCLVRDASALVAELRLIPAVPVGRMQAGPALVTIQPVLSWEEFDTGELLAQVKAIRTRACFNLAQRAELAGDRPQALHLYDEAFRNPAYR